MNQKWKQMTKLNIASVSKAMKKMKQIKSFDEITSFMKYFIQIYNINSIM